MTGITDIKTLLKDMTPKLHKGTYVFCTVTDLKDIDVSKLVSLFLEEEGWTIILEKSQADLLNLSYSYESAWITLTIHSSLDAVGLTAAFSAALSKALISCNVVAAYYHDHIFVNQKDAALAMSVLEGLSK